MLKRNNRIGVSNRNILIVAVVSALASTFTAAHAEWIRRDSRQNVVASTMEIEHPKIRKTIRYTKQAMSQASEDYTRYRIPIEGPFRGTFEPKVDIVAFLDFNDPFSAKAWKLTISRLLHTYPNDVRVSFRYCPNASSPESVSAAYAALEAIDQGFSWQMHDLLFANQSLQTPRHIERYAERLGLDMARYKRSIKLKIHHDRIARDIALAESARIEGTPTFYLNGRRINGALQYERMESEVRQEIDRANQAIIDGASPDRLYQIFASLPSLPSDEVKVDVIR